MTPWSLPATMRNKVVVNAETGCWEWTGRLEGSGHGRSWCPFLRRMDWAHRRSYRLLVEPIPDGLTIDHLCFNRSCINPDHLEPVTQAENNRRAAARRRRSTHYPCGHERNEENTYTETRRGVPFGRCHPCKLDGMRRCKARKQGATT